MSQITVIYGSTTGTTQSAAMLIAGNLKARCVDIASDTVSADGNPKISEHIRLRSGYGAVDGRRAVETALSSEIFESRLDGEYNVSVKGGNLEIMLTFEKGEGTVSLVVENESFTAGDQNTLLIKKRSKESVSPLSVIGIGGRFSLVVRST